MEDMSELQLRPESIPHAGGAPATLPEVRGLRGGAVATSDNHRRLKKRELSPTSGSTYWLVLCSRSTSL